MRDISAPTLARAACVAVIVAVFLGGCSTIQVTTEYDRSARFDGLSSYAWLQTRPEERSAPRRHSARFAPPHGRGVELASAVPPVSGDAAFLFAITRSRPQSTFHRARGRPTRRLADPMTRTSRGRLLIDVLAGSQSLSGGSAAPSASHHRSASARLLRAGPENPRTLPPE